jgi:chromosome segregation ATPase
MNNLLNKNSLLFALIILLLVTSWWGQSETGANKQLTQEKEAAEAQLAKVEAGTSETQQALQEKTAALENADKKLQKAEQNIHRLAKAVSEKKAALTTFEKEEKILLEKINELEFSLRKAKSKYKQTASQQQQQHLQKTAQSHKENQEELKESQTRIAQLEQEQAELKTQTEARIAQLQAKQDEVMTEAESLQAQVIGFEKVVEERNAALAELESDLHACKVNTKVLISKITEQENTQLGMEEKMRLMVQDFSEEAAPEQEEQPAQAE